MKPVCAVRFTAADGCLFRYTDRQGNPALEAKSEEGMIAVSAWYTSHDSPLVLRGNAGPGEEICLVLRPWRIELYVSGVIVDEEWPFGDARFADGVLAECHTELSFAEVPEREAEPDFAGSFTGAEGWFPGNGVFVGDCMPYTFGGRYHVLYLKDRHHHRSKWGKGAHQWAHISSTDLIHWDIHPLAVEIDDPAEGSICTGSWIYENGVHQLYYTVRMSDGSSAPIRRSLSEDGWHYEKDRDFSFTLSDAYTGSSARDPKVVRADDGTLHMFVTTTERASGRGCLVHLTSGDGDKWEEEGMIYVSPDGNEPECPDYFSVNGWYYLVFSHYGRAQYLVSDKPFSDWRVPADPHIPCSSVPKAAIWNGRIIFAGFVGHDGYGGHLTFMEASAGENGELSYFPVKEMRQG